MFTCTLQFWLNAVTAAYRAVQNVIHFRLHHIHTFKCVTPCSWAFLNKLTVAKISRSKPTIYLVQCHITLLTCQHSVPYDQMHDSFSHPYIHSFHFYFNIIIPFYLTCSTCSSDVVAKVLYVFRNSVRVTCCTNQCLIIFILKYLVISCNDKFSLCNFL